MNVRQLGGEQHRLLRSRGVSVQLGRMPGADEWDRIVAERNGIYFHRYAFLSVIGAGLGYSLDLRTVMSAGRVCGVAPMLFTRHGPLTTVNWLPFPYLGPLVPPELLEPAMAALARHERHIGCLRSQHELTGRWTAAVPGYESRSDRTFVVPLEQRSDDDLLHGMNPARRSTVRRAVRNGMTVRPAARADVTRLLPRLCARPFERQGLRPPYPPALFEPVWERWSGDPDVLVHAAELAGRTVGVQISFAGAPTALAWIIGCEDDRDGSDAYAVMMWRTMCWARDRGCRELDLVGAPTEGIATSKQRLGGQERRYTVFTREARAHRLAEGVAGHLSRHRTRPASTDPERPRDTGLPAGRRRPAR